MKAMLAGIVLLLSVNARSQKSFTIYFNFDRYSLTSPAKKQLDSFLLAEKESIATSIINIDGYCDLTGSDDYNQFLSISRADAVKKYLSEYGLQAGNFGSTSGHGEKEQVNENATEEERQLNRRVVISITNTGTGVIAKKDERSLTEKITDTTAKAGTQITLKNINFFGGTPFLLPESSATMDELLTIMRRNPKLVIEIQGHICCIATPGDSPYGPTGVGLSEERAKAIYAELIGHGIEANRVSYKGFGHSMPIFPYPEQTEEERVANRRVEIKIINK